ncbi:flagellar basal body-associated FliL family protein [Lentzea nigeriaca]|uniref:flagellar basal body protein FliL n=1 Tax=Lentzea nigeriaca TaxID=1128665 RepID=UPI00195D9B25|nr:flagellar basal body protein FliL [Lentzea nigeriaca]MBM7857630.1 hypothetical protein [Lentzea nigeriaca]
MTWQEELQKLDLELASGRISADDYRRRRDEVLAGSASAPAPQQQQGPFAPPFRWQATPPQQGQQPPNPDATQVVGTGQAPAPDATQVVNTQQKGDADRTQFVRPVTGPNPQQGGWQSQQPISAPPPWTTGDGGFGPVGEPSPGWIAQGPEAFDDAGERSGKGKIFAIIGVILVLALIGGGIWWFTSRPSSGGGGETSAQTTSQTPTSKPKPKDDLEIADLPGTQEDQSGIKTFDDVVAQKLLTDEENAAYTTAGATKVRVGVSKLPNGDVVQVITAQASDAAAAATAVEALTALQVKFGMKPYSGVSPASVSTHQVDVAGDKKGSVRAHYVHKNTIVRVQVAGKDQAAISKDFDTVLAAQLSALPTGA